METLNPKLIGSAGLNPYTNYPEVLVDKLRPLYLIIFQLSP